MSRKQKPLLFSIPSYAYLLEALLATGRFERGAHEAKRFPDGELGQKLLQDVNNRDVILIGGTSDADIAITFDLSCGLVKYGAETLKLVIPYFSYSTMERAVKPGEIVTAKTRARLLSAIPQASHGNTVFFLDLHAEGVAHYLEGEVTSRHVYGKPVIMKETKRLSKGRSFVLGSADAGRAKWIESLARDMNVPPAFAYKSRIDGSTVESRGVNGPVKDKLVVLYDDMIRTGGSLIEAGKSYKAAGAKEIAVIATHALLPGDALDRLRNSGLFSSITVTNSTPRSLELQKQEAEQHPGSKFFKVVSIVNILADALTTTRADSTFATPAHK